MKLCKDCKWGVPSKTIFGNKWDEHSKCANPSQNKMNAYFFVSGDAQIKCIYVRGRDFANDCGPDGKAWEAKEG